MAEFEIPEGIDPAEVSLYKGHKKQIGVQMDKIRDAQRGRDPNAVSSAQQSLLNFQQSVSAFEEKFTRPNPPQTPTAEEPLNVDSRFGADFTLKKLGRFEEGKTVKMNKLRALADLGYGTAEVALREAIAADVFNAATGRRQRMTPLPGDEDIDVQNIKGSSGFAEGFRDNAKIGIGLTGHQRPGFDAFNGFGGVERTKSSKEILGHELTHILQDKDKQEGFGGNFPVLQHRATDRQNAPAIYPEYEPSEHAPALAAVTRLNFKTKGKRITSAEEYDELVSEYTSKSANERDEFRRTLPVEVSRFYGYIDTLEKTKGRITFETPFPARASRAGEPQEKTFKGKERLERFHDINRKMIPGLVHEDGFRGSIDTALS